MRNEHSKNKSLLSVACVIMAASFGVTAMAQDEVVVAAKASVSASYAESLKKYTERTEDGTEVWYDVLAKDTYKASATFTLDAVPADWTELAQELTVAVGGVECSPVISLKSNAKGGSATLKEKDNEAKSTLACTVKWSKKTITVSLSGSNYEGTNLLVGGDDGGFEDEVEVFVEMGGVSASIFVPVNGKGKTTLKKIRMGRGEDAYVDEYYLVSWSAKGSAKESNTDQ